MNYVVLTQNQSMLFIKVIFKSSTGEMPPYKIITNTDCHLHSVFERFKSMWQQLQQCNVCNTVRKLWHTLQAKTSVKNSRFADQLLWLGYLHIYGHPMIFDYIPPLLILST